MVGPPAEMKPADIVKDMLDRPYELGKTDCLSFVVDFFTALGVPMPTEWHGWTRDNYAARWLRGEGRAEFREFLLTYGTPVSENYMECGDVIIFDLAETACPAIYLGNGHCMILTEEHGISVVPRAAIRAAISGVRRYGR